MENQIEAPYIIENIIMMRSGINRVTAVTFDHDKTEQSTKVNVETNIQEDNIRAVVTLTVHFQQTNKESKEVEFEVVIEMLGVFKKHLEESEITFEQFTNVNAPAIMFPYIREHVSLLTLKAGLGAIFLAPVDFTKKQQAEIK